MIQYGDCCCTGLQKKLSLNGGKMPTPISGKLRLTQFVPQEEGTFQVQEFVTEQQKLYTTGYRIHPDFVLTWTLD